MRLAVAAWFCVTLVPVATAAAGASTFGASESQYSSTVVMRAYAGAGLGLFSEGRRSFGQSGRPLYLTLTPGTWKTKGGVAIRGADFSVLVFPSSVQARDALTSRVKAQLRAGHEPWVQKANLVLVARVAIFSSDHGTLATWSAAKRVLAHLS